jgi:hypothetical protein
MIDIRATYPRVREIISKQNNEFRAIDVDVLANACLRGERIHAYCTAWCKNLFLDEIEPEYQPYFDSFVAWAELNVEEILHSTVRLYDDKLRFTGEFDMIVKMKESKKISLIDIKTSACKSKSWPLQLAAYGHLCKENGYEFDTIMNVHLKKFKPAVFEEIEGKKVLISPPHVRVCVSEYEDIASYWEIFSSALKCFDYFDRKESK